MLQVNSHAVLGVLHVGKQQPFNVSIFSSSVVKDHARAGQRVTVKLTSKDGSQPKQLSASILSRPTTCNRRAKEPTSLYCAVMVLRKDRDGLATFAITTADGRGSVLSTTSVTDGSSVRVDTTAPILAPISIRSNNVNNAGIATRGNSVTLSFQTGEALQRLPLVRIAGEGAACSNQTVSSFNCSITVRSATIFDRRVRFAIQVHDVAGNRREAG